MGRITHSSISYMKERYQKKTELRSALEIHILCMGI